MLMGLSLSLTAFEMLGVSSNPVSGSVGSAKIPTTIERLDVHLYRLDQALLREHVLEIFKLVRLRKVARSARKLHCFTATKS